MIKKLALRQNFNKSYNIQYIHKIFLDLKPQSGSQMHEQTIYIIFLNILSYVKYNIKVTQ